MMKKKLKYNMQRRRTLNVFQGDQKMVAPSTAVDSSSSSAVLKTYNEAASCFWHNSIKNEPTGYLSATQLHEID